MPPKVGVRESAVSAAQRARTAPAPARTATTKPRPMIDPASSIPPSSCSCSGPAPRRPTPPIRPTARKVKVHPSRRKSFTVAYGCHRDGLSQPSHRTVKLHRAWVPYLHTRLTRTCEAGLRRNQAQTEAWPDKCICGEPHTLIFTTRTAARSSRAVSTGASSTAVSAQESGGSPSTTRAGRAARCWPRSTCTRASPWRFSGIARSRSRWRSTPRCPTGRRGKRSSGSVTSWARPPGSCRGGRRVSRPTPDNPYCCIRLLYQVTSWPYEVPLRLLWSAYVDDVLSELCAVASRPCARRSPKR